MRFALKASFLIINIAAILDFRFSIDNYEQIVSIESCWFFIIRRNMMHMR
jgi:hypothetical protein